MIHEDFWSPIDFFGGNIVSFCIVFLVFKLLFSIFFATEH